METKAEQQENVNTAVTVPQQPKPPIVMSARGLELTTMDELWRFAGAVAKSGLAPKSLTSQEAIFVALEMGKELGLAPMQGLQNIAVINGRPSLWGDAVLGVCRGTGQLEVFEEWYESGGVKLSRAPVQFTDDTTAVCRVKRRGMAAQEESFSVGQAKTAGLWNQNTWKNYPARMLKMRARGFALRDQFGDALRGLPLAEEVQDIDGDERPRRRRASALEVTVETIPGASQAEAGGQTGSVTPPTAASTAADDVPMGSTPLGPVKTKAHDELEKVMGEEGVAFSQVATRALHLGWAPVSETSAWTCIEEIPEKLCRRIINARNSFFGGIVKQEES